MRTSEKRHDRAAYDGGESLTAHLRREAWVGSAPRRSPGPRAVHLKGDVQHPPSIAKGTFCHKVTLFSLPDNCALWTIEFSS
jgi:hypothetical protein